MSIEMTAPRSRRALLAAAAGAAAATVVSAIDRPAPVRAGTDGDVVLGAENTATSVTAITNTNNNSGAQAALSASRGGEGDGIRGSTDSDMGYGVRGESPYVGVHGHGGQSGVEGLGNDAGVYGEGQIAGVQGGSGAGFALLGVGHTGVGAVGIAGTAPGTPCGTGVYGYAGHTELKRPWPTETGVYGYSSTGTGVRAESATGSALDVRGKATFSRSGKATILAGKAYADVDLRTKGGLSGSPLCFANLTAYRSGVYVAAVRPNYPTTGKLRIYLNKAVTATIAAAWVVLG